MSGTALFGAFALGVAIATRTFPKRKVTKRHSSTENELRFDLAVAHKACNYFKMDELVWNHISARFGDGWLITPGRQMW